MRNIWWKKRYIVLEGGKNEENRAVISYVSKNGAGVQLKNM